MYFAGVMVRLMLTLTPCVCVLAAIAFSHTYEKFLADEKEELSDGPANKLSRKESGDVDGDAAKGVTKSLYDKVSY